MKRAVSFALLLFGIILAVLTFSAQCQERREHAISGRATTHNRIGTGSDYRVASWRDNRGATRSELGYLSPSPLPHTESQATRLSGSLDHSKGLSESPEWIEWRGLVVLPDLSVVMGLDPEFAETQASVTFQESTWRCEAYRITEVQGVTYEVFGLFQLLYDSSMRRLTESMSYMKEDLLKCAPNALVAEAWYHLTNNGVPWRLWVAKPQYRSDGHD